VAQKDEVYKIDMKDIDSFTIQWNIRGIKGYQVFKKDGYNYQYEEEIDEPDVTIVIRDLNLASRFLKGDYFDYTMSRGYNDVFKILHTAGWKIIDTPTGKSRVRISKPFLTARFNEKNDYSPLILTKLPMFREFRKERDEEEYGSYIPINQSLGTYENQVIPYKVFEHFINKASNIIARTCPCRIAFNCQNHDISLGCMYMGDDTLNMVIPEEKGRVVSKEEALDHVRRAIDNGLIPLLGRAVGETESYGIEDTGHFLSCCFCCTCCCINGKMMTYGTIGSSKNYHKIEGVTIDVDETKCIGCGSCIEVCVFKGREIVNGKAKLNPDLCLGCGRCAEVCPTGATTIEIDDMGRVNEIINKIEEYVNVE
ncbi:MAG: 4Fe-4S binding protein, partial [Promethearchaeota archaeon]